MNRSLQQPMLPWVDQPPSADEPVRFQRVAFADVAPLILEHHYSGRLPGNPVFSFAWLQRRTVVAAATWCAPTNRFFGPGALELTRLVRHPSCALPLTSFLSACVKVIRADKRRFLFLLSYADSSARHHGGVYQAFNGIHVAIGEPTMGWRHRTTGQLVSKRSMDQSPLKHRAEFERVEMSGRKYLYVWPIHCSKLALLKRFGWKPLPYPKPDRVKS